MCQKTKPPFVSKGRVSAAAHEHTRPPPPRPAPGMLFQLSSHYIVKEWRTREKNHSRSASVNQETDQTGEAPDQTGEAPLGRAPRPVSAKKGLFKSFSARALESPGQALLSDLRGPLPWT